MTDLFKILDDLSALARREEPPKLDVASRVVLQLSQQTPAVAWPMVLFASVAAAAAVVVLGISLPLMEMLTDPLSAFFLTAANALP